jgi:sporulation protein YlmC with PRC-barrel domain
METIAETSNYVKSKEVVGVAVINAQDESLGKIHEIVINKITGQVAYAVLDSGSFLGMGGKFFALPWQSLKYDAQENSFIINLTKDQIKNAPGFDKDNWPKASDTAFWSKTSAYYQNL